ncbi:glycosyltransferase family 2 protein, partial [Verrucomicrobiota bacterium]
DMLEQTVCDLVGEARQSLSSFEVIVVENGSTDNTWEIARDLEKRFHEVRAARNPRADYGEAMKTGFLDSRGLHFINFSVDWCDVPHVKKALACMDDHDVVLSSKALPAGRDDRPAARRFVTCAYNVILRGLFGIRARDTHALNLYRASAARPFLERCRTGRSLFPTELVIRCERGGLRITEIPICVAETRASRKSIVGRAARAFGDLFRLRWILWRERSL